MKYLTKPKFKAWLEQRARKRLPAGKCGDSRHCAIAQFIVDTVPGAAVARVYGDEISAYREVDDDVPVFNIPAPRWAERFIELFDEDPKGRSQKDNSLRTARSALKLLEAA